MTVQAGTEPRKGFARTLYLGAQSRKLAVNLGYGSPEIRPTAFGVVSFTAYEPDVAAFVELCNELQIKDFK